MELISREEVERLLIKWFTQCTEEEFFDLKKAVDELPEIKIDEGYIEELERKVNESRQKGKWIIKRDCEEVIVTCSNCGAKDYIPTTIDERFYFNRNYCWECGADMRSE